MMVQMKRCTLANLNLHIFCWVNLANPRTHTHIIYFGQVGHTFFFCANLRTHTHIIYFGQVQSHIFFCEEVWCPGFEAQSLHILCICP
jgi:hypothetical protein